MNRLDLKKAEDSLYLLFQQCNGVINITSTKEKLRNLLQKIELCEFQKLFFQVIRTSLVLDDSSLNKFEIIKTLLVKLFENDGLEEKLASTLNSLFIAFLEMLIGIFLFYFFH